jgi:hypothetical protein
MQDDGIQGVLSRRFTNNIVSEGWAGGVVSLLPLYTYARNNNQRYLTIIYILSHLISILYSHLSGSLYFPLQALQGFLSRAPAVAIGPPSSVHQYVSSRFIDIYIDYFVNIICQVVRAPLF